MAFTLVKPDGFDFRAGQYVELVLSSFHTQDWKGNARTFSLASAPYERDLQIAMRMNGTAYKRFLADSPLGTGVELRGPVGEFQLDENGSRPAVLLAGGIGIAPFLSMIRQAVADNDEHQLYLFYSNRRPEDAAFLAELEAAQKKHARFHLIATMAEMEKSKRPWSGERGFINAEMLKRHLPSISGPIYYIAGPPGMVAAMRDMLVKAGVDEDDVRAEDFAGY